MNNPDTTLTTPQLVAELIAELPDETPGPPEEQRGRKRELLPTRFQIVVDFLRSEAFRNDAELEQAIAIVFTAMKDGSIRRDVGGDLLENLIAAFRNNDHMRDVLTLTRESTLPVTIAEIERIASVRREKEKGEKR